MAEPTDAVPDQPGRDGTPDPRAKPGRGAAEPVEVGRPRTPFSQQVGRIAMVVAGAVFTLFALFNAQYVDFSWVFGSSEVVTAGGERVTGGVPLIVLLIAAFVLGAIVGAGAVARRRPRR